MADQRRDNVTRDVLQRLVDEAAAKAAKEGGRMGALEVLNEVSPHDMMGKPGREEFRADGTWANKTRLRCDAIRDKAWSYGVPGSVIVAIGVLWATSDKIAAVFRAVK